MKNHGKKYQKAREQVNPEVTLSLKEGLKKAKELAFAKFDESFDAHVNVGVDPLKGEQNVRGSVVLPHGTGKKIRILVFAKGEYADQAKVAGADYIGFEDLMEKIEGGWIDFDYAIATPDLMGPIGKLAKILGPKGLLPNKKVGTVTFDVGAVVKDLKKGKSFFKTDKNANVHFSFGRKSFDVDKLYENLSAFLKALAASKPPSSKGKFLKKLVISSTMGPGIALNIEEVFRA